MVIKWLFIDIVIIVYLYPVYFRVRYFLIFGVYLKSQNRKTEEPKLVPNGKYFLIFDAHVIIFR
jgi:hypothetical protein